MNTDQKYPLDHPPIFVCGVQRSGTTLLVKMLSRNTDVNFLPQETHLYPLLWKPGNKPDDFNDCEDLAGYLYRKLPEVNYGWTKTMPSLEDMCREIKELDHLPGSTPQLLRMILHN